MKNKLFQWKKDEEGDLVFVILGVLNFTKYKQATLFSFGNKHLQDANKYQGRTE